MGMLLVPRPPTSALSHPADVDALNRLKSLVLWSSAPTPMAPAGCWTLKFAVFEFYLHWLLTDPFAMKVQQNSMDFLNLELKESGEIMVAFNSSHLIQGNEWEES